MGKDNKPNIDDLRAKSVEVVEDQHVEKIHKVVEEKKTEAQPEFVENSTKTSYLDDYQQLAKDDMPRNGVLYPETWEFFYRCPTADEVAVFSTTPEEDRVKIMQAVIGIIRKCYLIIDTETKKEVSTTEIKSIDKMNFFLRLRSFYMNNEPIRFNTFSQTLEGPVEVEFTENSLRYADVNENLLDIYDGIRGFNFPFDDETNVYIPLTNLGMETKVLNYMVNNYKKLQKDETTRKEFSNFDKQFLAFVPYLFETGSESVESLKFKYNKIVKNDKLMKFYLEIMNAMNLGEKENIEFTVTVDDEEITEESPIKFPGGYKKLFTSESFTSKYFG